MPPRPRYLMPVDRPLQIFAFDPMLGHAAGNRISVRIENEPLLPGPVSSRVAVVDYDGANGCYYEPVDLDTPAVLMQGGLEPTESDPRFHQQMVFAVATKVLENFDFALGRKLRFRKGGRLRLFPHAFQGANAFYDPKLVALFFGYFKADEKDPGPNLPGQTVFTCLSHDIVAHETTHALVDRLKPLFLEPTNRDVFAFHEGFADIVAIFQHFSFQEVLTDTIQKTHGDLRSPNALLDLARQFGYATGMGEALRSAVDDTERRKNAHLYDTALEPHERGSILVAAVFDSFFAAYQQRIRDLVRIATGGTGLLPEGDLHPDLVNRIGKEASKSAQNVLTMCVRALDYLPPVDPTYGDFLRALVTADFELVPKDDIGLRAAMIEGFRMRGIYPENVVSLAEESLLWEDRTGELPDLPINLLKEQLLVTAQAFDRHDPRRKDSEDLLGVWASKLTRYAEANARLLDLDPGLKPRLTGFHSVFRFGPDGQLLVELVAQFVQQRTPKDPVALGGLPLRGGTTLIASAEGRIRYVLSKPLPGKGLRDVKRREADRRVEKLHAFVAASDFADPRLAWGDERYLARRSFLRTNFAALHRDMRRTAS